MYRDHLAEITALREKCDSLIEVLKEGEVELGEMLKVLEYVEERSESLRGACEDLLEEQVSYSILAGADRSRPTSSRILLNWRIV